MQIKRLRLTGFKSFVEPAELRIDPGLTGIVGPNGCGKSNLLEAIRWVMGESSARSMRGSAMDDVIFAGSASRPSRDFAEVSLLAVQDQGELFPAVDVGADGELEVTRRIERGMGSAYRANGRDVRAKDVALVFADAATGAHSPALVSQGKIAAVIAARPQERRAMLEEAAGIAGLHVRRRDAEQKLRAAEANLDRLGEILTDMEARAASLRRQARAAERYIDLSDRLRIAEARTLFARWREAAASAEAARGEAAQAQALVATGQSAHAQAAEVAAQAAAALDQCRHERQMTRDAANDAGHRLAALRAERDAVLRRLADMETQAQRLAEDRAREGTLASDAADAIARLTDEIATLKDRVAQGETQRPDFATRVADADAQARDGELALARAMAAQAAEQAELRVADAALAAARARLERADRDLDRLRAEKTTLPHAAPIEAARAQAEAQQNDAAQARQRAEAEISGAEAARILAADDRSAAQAAFAAATAALAALDSEAETLRRATRQTGDGARALDHVRAQPGYEHALAAALGDDLEAAVGPGSVRGWEGATALPDDPPLPPGAASLADHVTAPPELARRLAQIVVADKDEGQALRVGQRLVTTAGQMRRWDGYRAREGGAAAAQRLVRLNRIEALALARPAAQAALDDAQKARDNARSAEEAAAARLAAGRAALAAAEQALRTGARAADEATGQLERLDARRAALAERLDEAGEDRAQAAAASLEAQARRAALPDGAAIAAHVAALSAANEQARTALAKLRADQVLAERSIAQDRDRLGAAEADLRGWRGRAGEAGRRVAAMTARGLALEQERARDTPLPKTLAVAIAALEGESTALIRIAEDAGLAEGAAEAALRAAHGQVARAAEALATAREARAGASARADAADERRHDANRLSGERFECPPPLLPERIGFAAANIRAMPAEQADQERLSAERDRMGPVNLVAARELTDLEDAQATSRAEAQELTQAIHRLRGSIGSLNREGRQRLLTAFEAVDQHFRRLFTTLFNGGAAHLALVDSDDPLEAGLEIMAQPPGKKLATLTLLSGGEQALTAIALIFGLFLTNPAPICVLDEVDAPLDDANVERFCDLLDAMVAQTATRYLIVTHNAVTMSRMHRLFGVTMVEQGVSRLVSVDLGRAEALVADG